MVADNNERKGKTLWNVATKPSKRPVYLFHSLVYSYLMVCIKRALFCYCAVKEPWSIVYYLEAVVLNQLVLIEKYSTELLSIGWRAIFCIRLAGNIKRTSKRYLMFTCLSSINISGQCYQLDGGSHVNG